MTDPGSEPTLDSRARRLARSISWAGMVLFWLALVALYLLGIGLLDAILLSVLLVVVPTLSIAQVPLIEHVAIERAAAYWGSIATLWILGTACFLVGTRNDGAAAIGIVGLSPGPLLAWSAALTLGAMLLIFAFRWITHLARIPETRILRDLLPRNRQERGLFVVLSFAAGVGEEIAYRGYAIPALAPLLGLGGSAVATTVVFGLLHAYQGWVGIIRTTLMGAILAAGFLLSGSLWPAIIAHTLVDVLAGIVLADHLLSPRGVVGVDAIPD